MHVDHGLHESVSMLRRCLPLVLAIGCAAESPETTPCDEASTTLERCTGQLPEGFREACAADPDVVASAVLAEADAESCIEVGKADVGRTLFVNGCAALVHATAWVVWARSPSSVPLSAELKAALRPWYGDLVDTARISWGSDLVTRWGVFGHDLVFDENIAAQTFGHEIFVRHAANTDVATIALIGHELRHVAQYKRFDGVIGFAREYCEAFYDASYSYSSNALEIEAFETQDQVRRCLLFDTGCL